jgi:hypothetical protein
VQQIIGDVFADICNDWPNETKHRTMELDIISSKLHRQLHKSEFGVAQHSLSFETLITRYEKLVDLTQILEFRSKFLYQLGRGEYGH